MWSGKRMPLLCISTFCIVCHQNDVCDDSIGSGYVGGYCGLSESELGVFGKSCPVDFFVVCGCSSVCCRL